MNYKCVTSKNITPIATENNCKHSLAPMLSQALWGKRCAISKPMSVNLGIQHCLVRAGWTWKLVLYHVRWFIRLRYIYHSQLPTLGYMFYGSLKKCDTVFTVFKGTSTNLLVSKIQFDRWWWVWCLPNNQYMHAKLLMVINHTAMLVYCIYLVKTPSGYRLVYLCEIISSLFCSQDSASTMLAPTTQKLGKLTRGNESRDFWRILSGGPETWLTQIPLIMLNIIITQ